MTNYIALAIPVFFLLMGVELWAARRRGGGCTDSMTRWWTSPAE